MQRSSGGPKSTVERLPVNQRRHKVPLDKRKRVPTACSGETPCSQCKNNSRECQYPPVVEKISIPRTELDELRAKCARLEQCLEQAVPDENRRRDLMARVSSSTSGSAAPLSASSATMTIPDLPENPDDEAQSREGRLLQDSVGRTRYLGATSGATFLDLVKECMNTIFKLAWPGSEHPQSSFLGSFGRYQTFDSHPLVIHDVDPLWLPTKTEMSMMMAQLRYFVQDGSGDFRSGGIFYWGDLDSAVFESNPFEAPVDNQALRRLALLHAAFAMTCQLESPSEGNNNMERGETFFARARWLLGNPLDITMSTVHDIPVLAMMAIYLVDMNRRDAAYIYISLGMHIAIMHGVHRGCVMDEQAKRSFWTLYILDRWLSLLMGRPPAIHDEAIRLSPPFDVPGLPPASGLRAHVELSRISEYIVRNTYRISPCEHQMTSTSTRVDNALGLLSHWLATLPPELQMPNGELSNDRACCELHMTYNQLWILTVRPIFFSAVKRIVAERIINRAWDLDSHPQIAHIRGCVEAARRNLVLGKWVHGLTKSGKLLSHGLHLMFNAAVILLLHQLLVDSIDNTDAMDILFVIDCLDAEARSGSNYPKDCAGVLREITTLVQRLPITSQPTPSA
ncbi:hypothetical protein BX600DRAFT_511761 [Xylariales sp. PMI_506]|nr:hypothetical protein BX600DRAFT_511761 [Xylariales sp. PMI_506]